MPFIEIGTFKCNKMNAYIAFRKKEGPKWTNVVSMDNFNWGLFYNLLVSEHTRHTIF